MGLPVLGLFLSLATSAMGMIGSKGGGSAPTVQPEAFRGTPEDQKRLDPNRAEALRKAEERRRALAAGKRREHFRVDLADYSKSGSGLAIRSKERVVE